jgi:peptidoglycan/LPS O-acetylase OafA/YrhL
MVAAGLPPGSIEEPGYVRWITGLSPFNWGQFGVGLFFLVSGFVIPFSFRRYSRRGFAIARFFRVWPTYALGFLITVGVIYFGDWLVGRAFPYSAREIAIHAILGLRELTLSPAIDAIIWTLEIEVTFYLVCMMVAPWLREGSYRVFLIPACLFIGCLCLHRWTPETAVLQQVKAISIAHGEFIIFMFAGVALNFLYRQRLSADRAFVAAGAAIFAFLVLLARSEIASLGWSYAAAALVFCVALVWRRWVPDGPVWRFLADISYPLYVTHALAGFVLIELMLRAGAGPFQSIAAATMAAIVCAWLLHVIAEVPSQELGRDLARGHGSSPGKGSAALANDTSV